MNIMAMHLRLTQTQQIFCLFSWRHLEIYSVLLLRLLALSALIMSIFSVTQTLHLLQILLPTLAEEMIH